jgi:hypothetical protein
MPDAYKFPDEIDGGSNPSAEPEFEIEIENDTPPEDRDRKPTDPDKVRQLEVDVDDLDKYSKEAKDKLIKMKRVWNDERRAREAAEREQQVAIDAAQRLHQQNQELQKLLKDGSKDYKDAKKKSAKAQLRSAEKAYQEAYDAGDSKALLKAQQDMNAAQIDMDKAKSFKLPPLQEEKFVVQTQQQVQAPPPRDVKLETWQVENPWFGQDEEMTAAAMGLHEKLKRQGMQLGSDEYYETLTNTIRRRFPEEFGDQNAVEEVPAKQKADGLKQKTGNVVAPATRSTAPKRVRLTTSQTAIAKKLGLTPEQYVKELLKVEA